MPTVRLPAQLAPLAGGASSLEVEGRTVLELIEAIDRLHPGFRDRVLDGDRLRPGLAAVVDNAFASLRAQVGASSEVLLLPALRGG